MKTIPFELDEDDPREAPFGLIALQTDETIEPELGRYFSDISNPMYVTRVPSGSDVTKDTLSAMERCLPSAAALLPSARQYAVIGYGCTSGSSVIGSDTVEAIVKSGCNTAHVTDPLRSTLACASARSVSRFALLSPYVEEVNTALRTAFSRGGITTDVFGSFGVKEETKVVRISATSIIEAAEELGKDQNVDAVFVSCTNLRTYDALAQIEARIGKPVMSSNQSLAWHMRQLSKQVVTKT